MNNTDTQLKQALAKMLPDVIHADSLYWRESLHQVLDTELLHLCWLVENNLPKHDDTDQMYINALGVDDSNGDLYPEWFKIVHATWQQRTIALTKTLRVEIV